jgi:hypothetical protein
MAADTKQSTPNIGGNGFIWLLLAAAGTYFVAHQLPLEGVRPPTTEAIIGQRTGVQDVDARLWQDPFAAVAEVLARSPELKPENCQLDAIKDRIKGHCQSPLSESALGWQLPKPLLVMVAPVSGAPYSEQHESRRRTRYAILAGLNAEGFAPVDSEHVGFYWPGAARPDPAQELQSPKAVPFEWFEPKSRRESVPYKGVLLLWFDEDALNNSPLKQFEGFLCRSLVAGGSSMPWAKATILGPSFSTTLQAMVDESSKDGSSLCPESARPEFYINSATADDPTLIPDYVSRDPACLSSDTCLQDFFAKKGIKLYRMIATDEALALTIRAELRLRKVNDKASHIALVSEWDTLYGRALPDSIARCFGEDENKDTEGTQGCRQTDTDPFVNKPWLHRFKYLRGLDGQMPGSEASGGGSGSKTSKQDKEGKDSAKPSSDAKPQERAEGQGQFDYLRRLGDRIQLLDSDLRQKGPKGVEAVGILGSDLYDKLLVLQALRPLVPNALFFTTDLDALVLHPSALTYTRNLLVASSFGLQLRPAVQGETPPFRSSYQTAAFLATRTAIRGMPGAPAAWLKPRMFEVGSVRAVQFASPDSSHDAQFELDDTRTDNEQCQNGLKCEEIHPLATAAFRNVSIPLAVAFSVLAVCAACYPIRRQAWGRIDGLMKGSSSYPELAARGLAILLGLVVVISAVAIGIHWLWPSLARSLTDGGQPMILLDGLSLWPTILLRVLTLALCIGLIIRGYRLLNENFEKIFHDLNLMDTRQRVETEQSALIRKVPPWIRFVSHFWYRLPVERVTSEGERLPDHIARFWGMYIYQGYWRARFYRAAAGTVAMALLWPILFLAFANPPVPARGSISLVAYVTVTDLLLLTTWFLIFSVADTTLLTWRVIKGFRTETGIWPQKTLQQFSHRLKLPAEVLDDWIDLVFASKRTKCITTFIYYPFLIIALLVVSRSRLFANYGVSVPDLITTGIALLIVIGCAVALRLSAEALRASALRRLNDRIMSARQSQDGERLAGQLELLSRRVEELRDGAFTPFSQQPLVRAMLLPLGSFGGTALLEYLLLPGLS